MYADPEHQAPTGTGSPTRMTAMLASADARLGLTSSRSPAHSPGRPHRRRTPQSSRAARRAQHLEGLVVDTDLRWALLQRLVALGATGPEDIDAELLRDDTATGRRHAALAHAAVPTTAAKEAAFTAITTDDSLPNAILTSTIQGFVQPDQRDLLRAFVDRYFEVLPAVWRDRTNETARIGDHGALPRAARGAGDPGPYRRVPRR